MSDMENHFQAQLAKQQSVMEAQFQAALAKQQRTAKSELEAALAEQADEFKKALAQNQQSLKTIQEENQARFTNQDDSIRALKDTKRDVAQRGSGNRLTDELEALRSENSTLTRRVQKLEDGLAQLCQQTGDTSDIAQSLEQHQARIQNLETQLGDIDFGTYDEIAESYTIDGIATLPSAVHRLEANFESLSQDVQTASGKTVVLEEQLIPSLQIDIDSLRTIMDTMAADNVSLSQTVQSGSGKLDQLEQRVNDMYNFHLKMPELVGGMIEEISQKHNTLKTRVHALEASPTSQGAAEGELRELRPRIAQLEARLQALDESFADGSLGGTRAQLDALRSVIDKSDRDVSTKMALIEKMVVAQGDEMNKSTKFLNHSMANLSSRFNNLSTKEMADHIIGHMEQVYTNPSGRQLSSDVADLNSQLQDVKKVVGDFEARMSSTEKMVEGLAGYSQRQDRFAGFPEDMGSEVSKSPKKRRLSPNQNGNGHSTTNGGV
jgi:DNA repair exonuclease SbcCD ATPase subunit